MPAAGQVLAGDSAEGTDGPCSLLRAARASRAALRGGARAGARAAEREGGLCCEGAVLPVSCVDLVVGVLVCGGVGHGNGSESPG